MRPPIEAIKKISEYCSKNNCARCDFGQIYDQTMTACTLLKHYQYIGMRRKKMNYLKPPGRKSKKPIKYDFELNYYTLGRTAKELAEKYGVTEQTIYRWQREFKKEKDPA